MWDEESREYEYGRIQAWLTREGTPPCSALLGYRNLGVTTALPHTGRGERGWVTIILAGINCPMFPLYGDFLLEVVHHRGMTIRWGLDPTGWSLRFYDDHPHDPPLVQINYSKNYRRILEARLFQGVDHLIQRGCPLGLLFPQISRGILTQPSSGLHLPDARLRVIEGELFERLYDLLLYDIEPFEEEVILPHYGRS
jgi:hypothetical protein